MNVFDSLPVATGAAWLTWQPMTPAECMTLAFGVAALTLAAWGLRQMRTASASRDRQLDTQTEMLAALTRMVDERTAAQTESLAVLTRMVDERTTALTRMLDERTAALMRSLETVIERTKGD